jgi:hypothetical protein
MQQENCAQERLVLPETRQLYFDPVDFPVKDAMEFRLIYGGSLLKSSQSKARPWEKHQIRLEFHRQLKKLWECHPVFRIYNEGEDRTRLENIAKQYEGYVPIVNGGFGMVCDLDILLLRVEPPGYLVMKDAKGSGDIDNRLKVLFDALSLPQRGQVPIPKDGEAPDPRPFFVLLQDDGLITGVRVTTDRLLAAEDDCRPSEACVVIHATVKVADPTRSPYQLAL